jgi:hypothetical protein
VWYRISIFRFEQSWEGRRTKQGEKARRVGVGEARAEREKDASSAMKGRKDMEASKAGKQEQRD